LTLKQLQAVGSSADYARIIQRLVNLYPMAGDSPKSVVEDWVRKCQDFPLASVWCAYDAMIEEPGRFRPSLGDFLVKVKLHANGIESIKQSIEKAA